MRKSPFYCWRHCFSPDALGWKKPYSRNQSEKKLLLPWKSSGQSQRLNRLRNLCRNQRMKYLYG
nr:hypothetical protein [uncultured Oscillibacter sp.]